MRKIFLRKSSWAVLIVMLVTMLCGFSSALTERTLKEKLPCADAVVMMITSAIVEGELPDFSTVSRENKDVSLMAGRFCLSAHAGSDNMADTVTISTGYLDAEIALTMGKIFGSICAHLGGMTEDDVNSLMSQIDMNAMNRMEKSEQFAMIHDYVITVAVDPDSKYSYQMSLSFGAEKENHQEAEGKPEEADQEAYESDLPGKLDDANHILQEMDIDTSAVFIFDSSTDPNKALGQPNKYYSKVNFALSSIDPSAERNAKLSVNQGGSVEVFQTHRDAVNRQKTLQDTLAYVYATAEYSQVNGCALLRLSKEMQPAEKEAVMAAFNRVSSEWFTRVQTDETDTVYSKGEAADTVTDAQAGTESIQKGDIVTLGTYEQDNNSANGPEAIEWIVIDMDSATAILLSRYALDVYNTDWGSPTWDKSSLRKWMNEAFYQSAFSESDQKVIRSGTVKAGKNPNYSTNPGANTKDKVFALSYNEAERLLTDSERRCRPTVYAQRRQSVFTDETGNCYWWLRSPGKPGSGAAIVCTDGSFDYDVSYDGFCYGMRPAVKVDLEKYMSGSEAGTDTENMAEEIHARKGSTVRFGAYEQDGNPDNGIEPIEWMVISADDETATLMSVYALDVCNTDWGSVTWDHSTLRTWMNETFYEGAFSAEEKEAILTSRVAAEKHPEYFTDPGQDTEDKVFVLSYNEAKSMLTASQRCCRPTFYAATIKSVCMDAAGFCYWWLRTPGKPECGVSMVRADGTLDYDITSDGFCYGIRPVVRVDLSRAVFQKPEDPTDL